MPIFEYCCEECGHKFEAILIGRQTPECPQCHTQKLSQQLSVFAVSSKSSSSVAAEGCDKSDCCMMNGGGCSMN